MPDPEFDVDAWLDDYQPHTAQATICTNWDLITEHGRLEQKLANSKPGDAEGHRRLAEKITALESEIEAAQKTFTFQDIGGRWLALTGEHPPTKEQLEQDPQLDHNPETFPPAAIAESSVDPKLTVRQVERMRERLQMPQWRKIWAATLEANLGMAILPKSLLAGAVLRSNGTSGTTPVPGGSPAASSSDDPNPARGNRSSSPRTSGRRSSGSNTRTRTAQDAGSRSPRQSGRTTSTSGTPT